jgi:hypothetical protein
MDDKALDYIADAMIEASGALRVAITADNSVQYLVEKLDRAICKARDLKGLPAQRGIAAGVNIAPDGQILGSVQPPPIPHQDHGQADQSPWFTGYHNTPAPGTVCRFAEVERDEDNIPTRIVRPHMTEGA